jgi:subtilisin family serine protease
MKQFIVIIIALLPSILFSQVPKINGVLVEYDGKKFENIISSYNQSRTDKVTWEFIGPNTNTYFIQGEDVTSLYDHLAKQSGVVAIQYSHETELRKKPNDPRQSEQYYLNFIKAFDAWDFTTGGTTIDGKDIIIAIIDNGFDIAHEDISANIYINPDEIPDDNIDNDNNGYIDDVNGWNIKTNSGKLDIKNHGTNVIGMLGATGNNGKGITSINWNIKILPVNIETNESEVIKAYEFILAEKLKYNTSNGTKGANILVTNYSGGIANQFEEDHLVWCNLYTKLGSAGILNVAATTNEPEDVDELGDIPSKCSSPYLLIVNSTDKTDEKTKNTGYGSASVDISAPGENILTTYPTSQGAYKEASGTSLATPIVAAAAALLHSSGCENFESLKKNAPASAVLAIKDALMNSVDKKNSLGGKTVSGGRLNIFEALQLFLKDNCETVISPRGALSITKANMILSDLFIEYQSPNQDEITMSIFDTAGKLVWTQKLTPPIIGEKIINIKFTPETPGIYFISLISDSDIATKGFYANFLK